MSTTAKQIMAYEAQFWQAMQDSDTQGAMDLIAETSALAGAQGVHHFGPDGYKAMAEQGAMTLHSFTLSDERVFFPLPDVAVATYTATQKFTAGGKTTEQVSYDSSTWVRQNNKWVCAAHTETPRQHKSHDRAKAA